jgi:hypothetical protein
MPISLSTAPSSANNILKWRCGMQQVWLALIVGLILGWLIEWVLDWQFWRKTNNSLREENARLRADLAQAQAGLALTALPADSPAGTPPDAAAPTPDEGG